ncbi:MAG: hypothetical protein DLM73_00355 [Chthoniobacterales bacterium]|nr:MAG: hypothetical protein DLM73_00355 [Chthoniobacterales bacterium]
MGGLAFFSLAKAEMGRAASTVMVRKILAIEFIFDLMIKRVKPLRARFVAAIRGQAGRSRQKKRARQPKPPDPNNFAS